MMGGDSSCSTKLGFRCEFRSPSGVPERESVGERECDCESSASVGGSAALCEGFARRPKEAERTSMPTTPPLDFESSD